MERLIDTEFGHNQSSCFDGKMEGGGGRGHSDSGPMGLVQETRRQAQTNKGYENTLVAHHVLTCTGIWQSGERTGLA